MTGLHYNGPTSGTHLVQRNRIYNLSTLSSSATARVNGIDVRGGLTTYQNNMIALGSDMTANSPQINGIAEAVGTNNFYYNSVYIGGAGVAAGYGQFLRLPEHGPEQHARLPQQHLLQCAQQRRSDRQALRHKRRRRRAQPAGLTSNYNVLYAPGTGGFTGLFNNVDRLTLANWQTATGQDANSIAADPQFVSATDLHINPSALRLASPVDNAGTPIAGITDDFDGGPRNATTPDIGADEIDRLLAVTLACFGAQGGADRVTVTWETLSEVDNAGFNLYRGDDAAGPQTLLAYVPSQGPGSTQGFAYSYDDLAVQPGQTYWYWLEDVSLSGATTLHGPVSATVSAPTAVTLASLQATPLAPAIPAAAAALAGLAGLMAAAGVAVSRRRTR